MKDGAVRGGEDERLCVSAAGADHDIVTGMVEQLLSQSAWMGRLVVWLLLNPDMLCVMDRLVGLVVKASTSRAEDPPLAPGFFRGRVIPVTSKLALQ